MNNQQPENYTDNIDEIAKLIDENGDFDLCDGEAAGDYADGASESESMDDLLSSEEREQLKHKESWVENPWIKTLITAIATGGGGLALFFVLQGFFSLPVKETTPERSTVSAPEPSADDTPTNNDNQNLTGQIKADKATLRLSKDLKRAEKADKAQKRELAAKKNSSPKSTARVRAGETPVKVTAPQPPAPRRTYPTPVSRTPVNRSETIQAAIKPAPTRPQIASNPDKQVQVMAELGVFRVQSLGETQPEKADTASTNAIAPVPEAVELEEGEPSATLAVGTSSSATTALAVIFGARREEKLLLKTTAPFGPLEAGTYFVAEVSNHNGAVTASITGYIQDNQLKPVPEQSIIVLNPERGPLMARQQQPDGDGGFPLGSILLEGAGKALEYSNLPEITSTIGNGSSTITQRSGDKDILSGFLEGAVGRLGEEFKGEQPRQPRNQSFWYLPAHTEIILFVKTPVKL